MILWDVSREHSLQINLNFSLDTFSRLNSLVIFPTRLLLKANAALRGEQREAVNLNILAWYAKRCESFLNALLTLCSCVLYSYTKQ